MPKDRGVTEPSAVAGRRVLVLGAETELGRAAAAALAEMGARLALASGAPESSAAFQVQRLARRLGALAYALPAANEAALRVMARQVAKALGGLDALVVCLPEAAAMGWALRYAGREIARSGGGITVALADPALAAAASVPEGVRLMCIDPWQPPDQAAREIATAIAGTFANG